MQSFTTLMFILLTVPVQTAAKEEPATAPRPIPLTRPEMKQLIEDMKVRKPRIPLPELTEEEKEKLGERGGGYESRLRLHYMPSGEARGGAAPGAGAGGGRGRAAGGAARGQAAVSKNRICLSTTPSRPSCSGSPPEPTTASIAWVTRSRSY